MVQSEYGWSDEYVLGLTVARLRQIIEMIKERRQDAFVTNARLTEWTTRTLAQFIAATTGAEGKSLQREAAKIRLDLDESDTEAAADDPSVYVEQGSQTALSRNQNGSAERLLRGFGFGG